MKHSVFDIETVPNINLPDDLRPQPDMSKVKYGYAKNTFDRLKIEQAFVADFESKLDKTMSLDPFLCQICVLVGFDSWTDETLELSATTEDEEKILLQRFWSWLLRRYREDIPIVGFNSASFDFPVIIARSMLQDVSVDPAMLHAITKRQDYGNRHHYDLMQRLGHRDAFSGKLVMKSLDWNCKRFGLTGKIEGMDGSMVLPMFREGEIEEILQYCREDVMATAALFERTAPWIMTPELRIFDEKKEK